MKIIFSSVVGVALSILLITNTALAGPAVNSYVFAYTAFFGPTELIINGSTILSASSTGWYDSTGGHFSDNPNYIAGNCLPATCDGGDGKTLYNDFFVFDLTNVRGPIISATLSLANPSAADNLDPGFPSDGFGGVPTTYSNWDVSTPLATLLATNAGDVGIFIDLGSGMFYGSTLVDASTNGTFVNINLDGSALAALQDAEGGQFAVGGSLGLGSVVPEPLTLSLLGAGLACAVAMRRRKKIAA